MSDAADIVGVTVGGAILGRISVGGEVWGTIHTAQNLSGVISIGGGGPGAIIIGEGTTGDVAESGAIYSGGSLSGLTVSGLNLGWIAGTFEDCAIGGAQSVPDRDYDLGAFTVTDGSTPTNRIVCTTDDTRSPQTILFVSEGTNGTASISLSLGWSTETPNVDRSEYTWVVLNEDGSPAANWDSVAGDFQTSPELTWTEPAGGTTNRLFIVACFGPDGEVRRQVPVIIRKAYTLQSMVCVGDQSAANNACASGSGQNSGSISLGNIADAILFAAGQVINKPVALGAGALNVVGGALTGNPVKVYKTTRQLATMENREATVVEGGVFNISLSGMEIGDTVFVPNENVYAEETAKKWTQNGWGTMDEGYAWGEYVWKEIVKHEFGHTQQERIFGPLYLPLVGGTTWLREKSPFERFASLIGDSDIYIFLR